MSKPIEIDFDKFIPSLHIFVSYYEIMKDLGFIKDVKIEIDDNGPMITVSPNLTQDARKLFS